jgi:hypothetical protein
MCVTSTWWHKDRCTTTPADLGNHADRRFAGIPNTTLAEIEHGLLGQALRGEVADFLKKE